MPTNDEAVSANAVGVLEIPNSTLKGNQAYDLLRREIVSCRILPGTRFTEAELIERFNWVKPAAA